MFPGYVPSRTSRISASGYNREILRRGEITTPTLFPTIGMCENQSIVTCH